MEKPRVPHEYNIILLGETGAGKSMFINSFGYYLQFNDLRSASRSSNKFKCQVPAKFILYDADGREYVVEDGGEDANEGKDITASRTVACKSYLYYVGNTWLRLIDSAGVGATQGMEMDEENIDDIIRFISRYRNLHAIVLVVKSTETRLTNTFKYCLSKLLSQLDKAAIENLVFLLTFSDGNGYQPGDAKCLLQNILKEIEESHPELRVRLNKDNVYCVDNNCLKFIVAQQQKGFENFEVESNNNFEIYDRCFEKSSEECARFLKHVIGFDEQRSGLIPHPVRKILNISQARKFIALISPILEEIRVIVRRNESTLNQLLREMEDQSRDTNSLENLINIQHSDIEIEELRQAQTVCKSKTCRKEVLVDAKSNLMKFHYSQVCCEGCEATLSLRLFCQKFNLISGQCRACGCPATEHERRYSRTREVKRDVFDVGAFKSLSQKTSQKEFTRLQMLRVESKLEDLNEEKKEIERSSVTFAQFLRNNTALPFSSHVEKCYKQLSQFNNNFADANSKSHRSSEANVRGPIESTANTINIEIEDIFRIRNQLFRLKLYGAKIERVCEIDERRNRVDDMKNRQVDIKIGLNVADKFDWVYYKHGDYKNRNKEGGNSNQNRKTRRSPRRRFNKSESLKSPIDFNPPPQEFAMADGSGNRSRQAAMIVQYDQIKNQVQKTLIVRDTFEVGSDQVDLHGHAQLENNQMTFYNASSASNLTTPSSRKVDITPFVHSRLGKAPFSNGLTVNPSSIIPRPFPKELPKIEASNEVTKPSVSANSTNAYGQTEPIQSLKAAAIKSDPDKHKIIMKKFDNSDNNLVYKQFFGN